MQSYEFKTMVIVKKSDESKFFLKKGGAISSLLTSDCLFDRPIAWAESRQYTETHGDKDIIVFRTVGENIGILGKTPEEILACKKEALLNFCRRYKSIAKEKRENAQKKKKTSTPIKSGGLFDGLGENWESKNESGQSRDNRPYDIF